MMNPMNVASNRTARLVREARTPVYSTESKAPAVSVRDHITAVEIDDMGRWSSHMPDSEVDAFCGRYEGFVSDIDHSAKCWCLK